MNSHTTQPVHARCSKPRRAINFTRDRRTVRPGGKQCRPLPQPPRLSLINPETASKPIKDALALLPVINVFRALANAESLYPYFSNYLLQLFRPMELDKALERMIVLHVARRSDCIYAWRQNVVVGHSVGVTDEQIAALEKGEIKASCFSEAEQAAFAFTNEVMDLIEATDHTYDAVKKHFSDRAITEMFYVIGTYMMLARVLRTGRIPLDNKPADSPQ
jgi:alkylhydroperoxidase family enzyme